MPFRNPIIGGTTLLRPAIQSPNYLSGSAGWAVKRDGSAEFNNIIIRGSTTVSGVDLYYSGTPALGNLVLSIAPAAGTDQYGNKYPAGHTSYDNTNHIYTNISAGKILVGQIVNGAIDTTDAGEIVADSSGAMIQTGTNPAGTGFTDSPEVVWQPGEPNQPSGSGLNSYMEFRTVSGTAALDASISGALVKGNLTGGFEKWTVPTLNSGYSNLNFQFRRDNEDSVYLIGSFQRTTAYTGAGHAAILTLPSGYIPKQTWNLPGIRHSNAGVVSGDTQMLVVSPTGTVTHYWGPNGLAANDVIDVSDFYPLGNIE